MPLGSADALRESVSVFTSVLSSVVEDSVFGRLAEPQSSRIIMNAHRINAGEFPNLSNGRNTDFFYIEAEEPELAAKKIVELVKYRLPKYCHTAPSDIQVL